jgi:hypothetical protein
MGSCMGALMRDQSFWRLASLAQNSIIYFAALSVPREQLVISGRSTRSGPAGDQLDDLIV